MASPPTEQLLHTFDLLPGTDDVLFRQLWLERRLHYLGDKQAVDVCDQLSARLACAALRTRHPLLVVLPDLEPHRPALLFATALLRYWWDFRLIDKGVPSPVFYFGSHIGIREHLTRTKIADMSIDLAGLFEEDHLVRRGLLPGNARVSIDRKEAEDHLPRVTTIYAPADPVSLLKSHRPGLVAIDLGESARLDWLRPLLQFAREHHIQTIAWGQNALSLAASEFADFGRKFVWPPQLGGQVDISHLLSPPLHRVTPLLVGGPDSDTLSASLRQATKLLASASQLSFGQLGEHGLAIHWSYLRTLEGLHVPAELYEAEAPRLWGMKSLDRIQSTARRFRETCWPVYPELAGKLEEAAVHLDHAWAGLKQNDSPLWRLLSNVCIEEPASGEERLITFTSHARCQLFTYALLARYNISSDDLHDLRISITTAAKIRTRNGTNGTGQHLRRTALLVGVPGPFAAAKLLPVLLQEEVQVLIYPHQLNSLTRRVSDCDRRLQIGMSTLTALLPTGKDSTKQFHPSSTVVCVEPSVLDAGTAKARRANRNELPLADSPAEEIGRLFEPEEELEFDTPQAIEDLASPEEASASDEALWCEESIEIRFDGQRHAAFAPDEQINVIVGAAEGQVTTLRTIATLKAGERVLFIQGQQRQGLYELLIARVHKHPAFELHLALVRRWQDDLINAFYGRQKVRTVPEFLSELQNSGSKLISPLTLRLWLARTTLCPDDPEDLRRLGEVLGLGFVESNYKRIAKAAARIRSLHRSLAHRLNRWLEEQVSGSLDKNSGGDLIDSELGLKFSDFKNSLLILRIESVARVTGPFLRSRLGRLKEATE
jgi:hypothetical protein